LLLIVVLRTAAVTSASQSCTTTLPKCLVGEMRRIRLIRKRGRRVTTAAEATVDDRVSPDQQWPHAPDATEEEVGSAGPKLGFDGKPLPPSPFGDGGFGPYGM
jgi:hypothetical protein